jgi:hypothetical protein
MVTQCDFTNTDGTVNEAQAQRASEEQADLITAAEASEIINAYSNGDVVSGCAGGRSGLCGYVNDDGSVSAEQAEAAPIAFLGDRLTASEANTIVSAYSDNTTVSECVSTPDTSEAVVDDLSVSSPAPLTAAVSYRIRNSVESGVGESLAPTVETTVDGSVVDVSSFTLRPGESVENGFDVDNLSAGTVEVCADVV